MSVFIDTAVIMYAGGADHPLREPCRELLAAVVAGRLDAVTSAEVIQEIHHRFTAIERRDTGVAMAEAALDIFSQVLPITDAVMRETTTLVLTYPGLSARDLVHVATCRNANVDLIVSPDRGFDAVEGLGRLDPVDAPSRLL